MDIRTGFETFDLNFNGFKNGQLTIFVGRPLCGKITFALKTLENNELIFNKKVAFFSTILTHHILNIFSEQGSQELAKMISDNQVYINDTYNISFETIKEECIKLKKEKKLDLIIIDSFENIDNGENKNINSKKLKQLALKLNVPVLLLASIFRFNNTINDLEKFCKSMTYDADRIVLFHTNHYNKKEKSQDNHLELEIIKNRNGNLGKLKLDLNNKFLCL